LSKRRDDDSDDVDALIEQARKSGATELNLSGRGLTTLPESIGQLTQLQGLDLNGNQLTALPEAMRNLTSLSALYLHGNDALGLPAEVLGPTWQDVSLKNVKPANPADILEYYFRTRKGKRPLNEAKLIIVGRGAVGKTSLVNRLINDRFSKREKKTDGIKITEWPIRLYDEENARLNVWDFGGQEIMHATHQFFLSQRSLYLLVLNGRDGIQDADAEYWLRLIESFGDESPVIVVMNKIKEHPFDLDRRALQQKFPAIREFIKTDCLDGTGIDDLHRAIKRETDRLEHLRDSFPAAWFSIKDRLGGMKKNFLSFDEYRRECAKMGEKEEAAQDSLAFYLHTLGIVLNYRNDPRLRDTHVLNPHWVTNGIYKIINSDKLEKQKGEIHFSDIAAILDRKKYPPAMHQFIIGLMKKFDLCFSFPGDECRYLIPELLDKQQPAEADEFPPRECLNFQYHYPVLPEGLLPRFIVRTHVLSEGEKRWRTGVILKFDGCRALVKADVQDRKVFISVSGPVSNRRRLLAVIRSDFERIHSDIRRLNPQQMVPVPEHPEVVVAYKDLELWESEGRRNYSVSAGGKILDLDVQQLLNGVDLDGARRKERIMEERSETMRLFYSYAHKDEDLRNELETHLKLMQRQGLIETWHDRRIIAGEEWKDKIDENLERADIILLLVSADFIASNYCWDIEMTRSLERHDAGEARVIAVIIRDVNWHSAPFARLQALPKDGRAVTLWPDKDTAWRNVSEGIERAVREMRRRP
jgi:internalin A